MFEVRRDYIRAHADQDERVCFGELAGSDDQGSGGIDVSLLLVRDGGRDQELGFSEALNDPRTHLPDEHSLDGDFIA